MAKDFYDEVARLLREAGWTRRTGGKGSHEKWTDRDASRVVIVPR